MKIDLKNILQDLHPEVNFEASSDYFSDGFIDSYDIIILVTEFEKKFGISIDGEDVTPENFKNSKTMQKLIASYISIAHTNDKSV